MVIFDTDAVATVVRRLAKENPDVVYARTIVDWSATPVCSYICGGPDNKGCIIGRAIGEVHPEILSELAILERSYPSGLAICTVLDSIASIDGYNSLKFKVEVRGKHAKWLRRVQKGQDGQLSWAKAVERANESDY